MKLLSKILNGHVRASGTTTDAIAIPSGIAVGLPEAAKALEEAWQRRRQELGGWTPSNGWLVDQVQSR